jgi:hypothetical protein
MYFRVMKQTEIGCVNGNQLNGIGQQSLEISVG